MNSAPTIQLSPHIMNVIIEIWHIQADGSVIRRWQ